MTDARHLAVPPVQAAHYAKNLIRQVVCELRFPTLFELEGPRPPSKFAQALRKEYPNYELVNNLEVGGMGLAKTQAHQFKAKRWTVTLRASAISLETTNYDSFTDLHERLGLLLKAAKDVIDSDFFTRVGLRYINSLPFDRKEISSWVNPEIVGALGAGVFGDVSEHSGRAVGTTETGGAYLFQHGLGFNPNTRKHEYVLDFDFSQEDVPLSETLDVARVLHDQEFAMFSWSLGEKAKQFLGPSTLKKQGA